MLRTLLRSAAALAGLTWVTVVALPVTADAETTDGKLTVIVNRDVDGNGSYDGTIDRPQPGIEIGVTDASGVRVKGVTDSDGTFILDATSKLKGGRYFVVAEIPAALSDLAPVPGSGTFQPLSTTVDVTSENQTVRMGVAAGRTSPDTPRSDDPTRASRSSNRAEVARFAIGDMVWRDDNRSGVQDTGESPASRISIQLLDVEGEVVDSTVSSPSGRYLFDNLQAGTYSVRFAGVPEEFRLTPAGTGGQRGTDSDPDYSGVTPPFTLGVGEPNVRPTTAADGVLAAYINSTIDAGITPLRYAVGNRVWLDLNSDGVQQPDEPAASATVSLLTVAGNVVATTNTDATGHYQFSHLRGGRYRLHFTDLPAHHALTGRAAAADPALDSDPDPATGLTPVFVLAQGAPNLVPAAEASASSIDFENRTLNAGLVTRYSIGDRVWLDNNGDGLLGPGDSGVARVTVQLLSSDLEVLATKVTSPTGQYSFDELPAGSYRIRFSKVPPGLMFTSRNVGDNPAVDSDVDQAGETATFTLGSEGPADSSIDAGLTSPANYPDASGSSGPPVDAAQSPAGGTARQIAIVGLALAVASTSCLLASRRRHKV
ncbi:MAG TPA: SdrD B-like domain-containing protein [Propionibacteriaceae bacterium]|nr:SdrD B-like domain-containing protein [Propionibacteriaceae bacterium]